jgi:cold-inducible RNA-binding protein
LAVRLFVGNLSYSTTEADLRTYFGTVAQPSQVVLPVDRETGRPRGFAFVEFIERSDAEQAIQRFNGQPFNGRPLAVSEARAREDRGPGGPPPRPGGFSGPRPGGFSAPPRPGGYSSGPRPGGGFSGPPRPFDPSAPPPPRGSRNFGPDAKPQRGLNAKAKKKEAERPRGPIPLKNTGRSFTLDDDSPDEALPDIDDFATSKPTDETEKDKEEE